MTTTDLICNLLFILILLVGVWYFFVRDDTKPKPIEDTFSISLDEYEKELHEMTRYPKIGVPFDEPVDWKSDDTYETMFQESKKNRLSKKDVDWKQIDRDTLSDEDFETMYQETKSGDKIVDKTDIVE